MFLIWLQRNGILENIIRVSRYWFYQILITLHIANKNKIQTRITLAVEVLMNMRKFIIKLK